MKFVADFHIHSKYSRATSRDMDLENLDKWAKIKGIKVLGSGDFTHPEWLNNLRLKLEPAEPGLFKLKHGDQGTRFMLTSEISCIYSKNNKVRKIHILVLAPSFEVVEKINGQLSLIGNLKSDGRPILGLDAKELARIVLESSQDCMVIPAHIWTPWFSLFGSKSGFNTIEECFEDYSKYIYAMETGLSSDPAMNWRLSFLDRISLVSNSDSHSPQKIGREANVFDTELSYYAIADALKKKDSKKFLYTIEFYPEEGKYHFDGHRSCDVCLSPSETKKYGGLCPVCGKPLVVGVLNRVEELADREEGFLPENRIPFKSLVPLNEIIADVLQTGVASKIVSAEYDNLIRKIGSEFEVLMNAKEDMLVSSTKDEISKGIIKMRKNEVSKSPGYDGVYGKISVVSVENLNIIPPQKTLF